MFAAIKPQTEFIHQPHRTFMNLITTLAIGLAGISGLVFSVLAMIRGFEPVYTAARNKIKAYKAAKGAQNEISS
jgi:hypothetical protein